MCSKLVPRRLDDILSPRARTVDRVIDDRATHDYCSARRAEIQKSSGDEKLIGFEYSMVVK